MTSIKNRLDQAVKVGLCLLVGTPLLTGCTKRIEKYNINGNGVVLTQTGIGPDRRTGVRGSSSVLKVGDTTIVDGNANGKIGDAEDGVKVGADIQIGYSRSNDVLVPYFISRLHPEDNSAQRASWSRENVPRLFAHFNNVYNTVMGYIDSIRTDSLNRDLNQTFGR
jgi:hypothetical protein